MYDTPAIPTKSSVARSCGVPPWVAKPAVKFLKATLPIVTVSVMKEPRATVPSPYVATNPADTFLKEVDLVESKVPKVLLNGAGWEQEGGILPSVIQKANFEDGT
jgi:hypothetical protein